MTLPRANSSEARASSEDGVSSHDRPSSHRELVEEREPGSRREPTEPRERVEALGDAELLHRVRAGEAELFEVVMRRYNQRVYRAVRAILRDEDETVDVMQEAYFRAFLHLRHLTSPASFPTWLTRIAVHEAFARKRRRRRVDQFDLPDTAEQEPAAMRGPEDLASDLELRGFLERAIDDLPETFRTVFVLRAVEGMSVAEAASALGIPEDTVKTRLFRARERLQASLTKGVGTALPNIFGFYRPRCDRVVALVLARLRALA